MMSSYKKLSKILQVEFKHPELLEKALTHRSYLNENKKIKQSNERLEFLGDAVLELIVSFFLYKHYPQKAEGSLTSLRSKIVQTKTLAQAAKKLSFPEFLKMSKGEKDNKGNFNQSILADTFEAVIGAIYIDQGYNKAYEFINKNLLAYLENILASKEIIDYKSIYQEEVQAKKLPTPFYKITRESGLDHSKIFTTAVFVGGEKMAEGRGKSKQEAQQQTAKIALEKIREKR